MHQHGAGSVQMAVCRLGIARAHAAAQIAVALLVPWHKARELRQRHFIDAAFKLHHHVQRHPVLVPAPGVELRVVGGTQVQIPVVTNQLKQVPDLLLSLVMSPRIAADVPVRHLVAQPIPGPSHHADVVGVQADFFVEFPEHRLLGRFAAVYAALRKLPAVGAYALAPEHLVSLVEQDDADVRPKAVPVKHNRTPKS